MLKKIGLSAAGALAVLAVGAVAAGAASRYLITSTHQIKPNVLNQLRSHGRSGPRGPQGPQGAPGAAGAAGAAGGFSAANVSQVTGPVSDMCPGGDGACEIGSSVATCPAGAVVLAGGFDGDGAPPVDATIAYDKPLGANAWEIIIANDGSVETTFNTVVTCAGSGVGSLARARRTDATTLSTSQRAQLASDLADVRAQHK